MKLWRPWWRRAVASSQPAPSKSRTTGPASDKCSAVGPLLVREPHKTHRPVDLRWLASLLLLAGVAVLLLGGLWNWVDTDLSVATAPEFSSASSNDDVTRRTDRLAAVFHETGVIRRHVEQLAGDAAGMEHFTFLLLRLVQSIDPFATAASGDETVPRASMSTAPPPADPATVAADAMLPPEIRFGTSRPEPRNHVTAYAADDGATARLPGVPINLSVIGKSNAAAADERHVIVARRGDVLPDILAALGVAERDAHAVASVLASSWFGRDVFSGGEVISVAMNRAKDHGRPWEVDIARNGKTVRSAVLADNGRFVRVAPRQTTVRHGSGDPMLRPMFDAGPHMKLNESLERLGRTRRLPPSLLKQLRSLCGSDIERGAALAPDDTARLLYNADAAGDPVLSYASLTIDGAVRRYYRFTAPDDGSTEYYDANGRAVAETMMKKPVSAGRLGDGFGWRIHPILRDRRFHEGVDYAAPFGSPIAAAGDGTIEAIGEESGYGKFVRIRHDFGYETTYAHISGVPHGLKIGSRIRRGQTVAYVGSTGLSTGPHLYFELRVNGHNVDPLRANLQAGRVLEGGTLAAFEKARRRTDRLVQASEPDASR